MTDNTMKHETHALSTLLSENYAQTQLPLDMMQVVDSFEQAGLERLEAVHKIHKHNWCGNNAQEDKGDLAKDWKTEDDKFHPKHNPTHRLILEVDQVVLTDSEETPETIEGVFCEVQAWQLVSATFDQTNKVYSTRAYACKGSQDGESQKYVIGRGNLEIFASTDNAKEVETAYEHALKKVQASNRDSIGEDVVEPEKLFWVLPDTNSMGRTTSRDAVRLSNTSDFRHQHAHIAPHYEVDDVSLDADSASHLVNWEQNTDTGNSAPPVTVDISAYTTHVELAVKYNIMGTKRRTIGHAFIDTRRSHANWEVLYCPIIWESSRMDDTEKKAESNYGDVEASRSVDPVCFAHGSAQPLIWDPLSGRILQARGDSSEQDSQDHKNSDVNKPFFFKARGFAYQPAGLVDCLFAQNQQEEANKLINQMQEMRQEEIVAVQDVRHKYSDSRSPVADLPVGYQQMRHVPKRVAKGWIKIRVHKSVIEFHEQEAAVHQQSTGDGMNMSTYPREDV